MLPHGKKPRAAVAFVLMWAMLGSMRVWADSPEGAIPKSMAKEVEKVLQTPGFEAAHWGILVIDAETGQTVFERNADHLFCPASVTKLFSTSAALLELGPDYQFTTPIHRKGEIDNNGRLTGDLILKASGDLALGGRAGAKGTLVFQDDDHSYAPINQRASAVAADPLAGLAHLARQIKDAGIRDITGDILVDDRLFESAVSTGTGPSKISSILVNDNVIDVLIAPGTEVGKPAEVAFIPGASVFYAFDVQVQTVQANEKPAFEIIKLGDRRYRVQGRIPLKNPKILKTIDVEDPASFARSLLIEELRKQNIKMTASPLGLNDRAKLPESGEMIKLPKVAELKSAPLSEYVKVTLKVSQNLYASTLPLLIAAHQGETTLEKGLRRQGELLKNLGVPERSVSFGGGAGGSRSDLASPKATVALLKAMKARPEFSALQAGLPILGRDGTLARIGTEGRARGHAFAKTGTFFVINELNGQAILVSKALAGYMETSSDHGLIFAFFVNSAPLPDQESEGPLSTVGAGKLLGQLCEVFYDWKP